MSKKDQRNRRKAGFEFFSPTVFKPKFVAWLVWEGLLDPADCGDRAKIIFAFETYLRAQYDLPDVPGEPAPNYAAGSFGEEFTALRDQSNYFRSLENGKVAGLLEREGEYEWNRPTRYLITARTAALRKIDGDNDQHERPGRHKRVEIEPLVDPYDRRRWEGLEEFKPDDYDPDVDAEDESADLSDEAISEAYDEEGYEVD